ncbi:MAG TPA: hypothetical protein VFL41_04570 [Gaiellaceae bacterium]|nr:hypothetical protein [Gaiellaceae bacterium]
MTALILAAAVLTSDAIAANYRGGSSSLSQAGRTQTAGRSNLISAIGTALQNRTMYSRRARYFKRPKLRRGLLTITGTDRGERIALRLKSGNAAILEVDVGDDGSADFSFKRRKIARIAIDARAGDDLVRVDEGNGVFTDSVQTAIDGGAGNDNLVGGSGAETLLGGDGNDSIDGNKGNDLARMGAGDDVFVWDPGDGSDVVEGQDGADVMRFNGANVAERVELSANGERLRFFRDPGGITMDTNDVESIDFHALAGEDLVTVNDLSGTDVNKLNVDLEGIPGGTAGDGSLDRVVVNGSNGDDRIDISGDAAGVAVAGLRALVAIQHQESTDELAVHGLGGNDAISAAALAAQAIALTLDGGIGVDSLAGGRGSERLLGGDGNDSLDGNAGNDLALMGAGDDTFVWDPGDGSDTVEGEAGADTMRFNGANIAEEVDLSANGSRLRFFRNVGTITMDTAGVERVDFNALGGADLATVNDLTGTDVTSVNADLAGAGGAGDGSLDRVVVNGTNGNDAIDVSGNASGVAVAGLRAVVAIRHQESTDELAVHALGGNDDISAGTLAAQAIVLTLDGGAGDDTIVGGQGSETLLGGDGNDLLDGFRGNDLARMGAGDDVFFWDPGDGSDTVEGEAGGDAMLFNGANIDEQIDVSANGNRVRFFRDIGTITMDTAGVERIDFNALGGADLVTVNDLSGTDLASLQVDLEGTPGGGDGQPDRVVVNATDGDDEIDVNGDAGGVKVSGLAATVGILHSEFANDRLEINTLAGHDSVDSNGLAAGVIQLFVDGTLVP